MMLLDELQYMSEVHFLRPHMNGIIYPLNTPKLASNLTSFKTYMYIRVLPHSLVLLIIFLFGDIDIFFFVLNIWINVLLYYSRERGPFVEEVFLYQSLNSYCLITIKTRAHIFSSNSEANASELVCVELCAPILAI